MTGRNAEEVASQVISAFYVVACPKCGAEIGHPCDFSRAHVPDERHAVHTVRAEAAYCHRGHEIHD